ncbi:hypothetical protein [Cylindrospermopsis raciborskii]|uniref:hypothetical protein n=1 Tax=Cylindrospermopsis raciborskii TaxID=77022 RepID=UPI000778E60B|nr:hypothetical protein [Cylindrospermopsis raciborskii]MCZ2202734.1 hypothetical protein [Cylindrospermopsis raciborskii PAMP2012]MCZ2205964.1 hypothetical protein [Cylindrospermopsis raciborskii PAMP2011]
MFKTWQIALVAEGPTDFEIIQAVLKAVLSTPFILTLIQPEVTHPQRGSGWGGVLKWCHQAQERWSGPLMEDPTLSNFDIIIIHLDADVAYFEYNDVSYSKTEVQAHRWASIPCAQPCPPILDTIHSLRNVLSSWLDKIQQDVYTVLCLPAQSSGTWLAVALLSADHPLLTNEIECEPLEEKLAQLPKSQRVKKTIKEYRLHAPQITAQWSQVKKICSQATRFEKDVLTAIRQAIAEK